MNNDIVTCKHGLGHHTTERHLGDECCKEYCFKKTPFEKVNKELMKEVKFNDWRVIALLILVGLIWCFVIYGTSQWWWS